MHFSRILRHIYQNLTKFYHSNVQSLSRCHLKSHGKTPSKASSPGRSHPQKTPISPLSLSLSFVNSRHSLTYLREKKLGTSKNYILGRSSEATFANAFEKQEAILRYLGDLIPKERFKR
ncbi:uncharacterized protein LOC123204083 [Mangifera indica]|uniref:uncharacterized protein LOC123204083 n=1 Tax=Mangifera indica TaxID=29780 RepID=UPI001CFAC7DA|nr:uncharacterized protein LOC123204083 [Mangifera indica]